MAGKKLVNRVYLFIFISVLLFSGYFITNIVSYQAAKDSLRSSIINTSLPLTRDNIYSEIQRDLMRPIFISSLMANDTFVKDWAIGGEKNVTQIKKYLTHIKHKYDFFASFFVSAQTGNYYYYDGILKKISKDTPRDKWYYDFTAKYEPYELTVDTNQAERNTMTIFINHRVHDYDHKLLGVTGVGLELERIKNLLSEYQVRYDRDIFLVDMDGNIQVSARNTVINQLNIKKAPGIGEIAPQILQVSYISGNFEYDSANGHMLLTSRYIPELNWFLLVVQNQNSALKNIWQNFIKNTMIGFILTLLILGVIISVINYYHSKLETEPGGDVLMGCFNRQEFIRLFNMQIAASGDFSLILFDIDDFKGINDRYGHICGDMILERIASIIKETIGSDSTVARWNGDEFMVIAGVASEEANHTAMMVLEAVNTDAKILRLAENEIVKLCAGIAPHANYETEASMTFRAESALADAKSCGHNTIRTA
ncbi:MAG: diguanylate cyclase [Deferribacterales bacterium]